MADQIHNHRSDIGRRVACRREQLGLSREDVAQRSGVSSQYLRYLEERPASPSVPSLTRVARALETTVAELTGSGPSVGSRHVPPHGEMVAIDPDECYELVVAHSVGRVAIATRDGPAIVPVNYGVIGSEIVFRAVHETGPAFVRETDRTAFEVDALDEAQGIGWSVLLVGPARQITDPAEIRRLAERVADDSWAPGEPDVWVRLRPVRVSGHRVHLRQ